MRRPPPAARAAFTLTELLLVLTIVGMLVALTAAAAVRVRTVAKEVTVRSDIQQMSSAVQAFKTKYGVAYLPSRVALREDGNYGAHADKQIAALEVATIGYLKQLWPKLQTQIDWNNNNQIDAGDAGSWVLEGDQCLVFFLGGQQALQIHGSPSNACLGFSENKTNPMAGATTGPLFDFPSDRLTLLPKNQFRSDQFLTFLDRYGTPYAYFSSRVGNDFNNGSFMGGDCATLGVQAYSEALVVGNQITTKFHNRDSFQIISAGRNKAFGPGGQWSPALGYAAGNPGEDDMSNFYDKKLGVGSQVP